MAYLVPLYVVGDTVSFKVDGDTVLRGRVSAVNADYGDVTYSVHVKFENPPTTIRYAIISEKQLFDGSGKPEEPTVHQKLKEAEAENRRLKAKLNLLTPDEPKRKHWWQNI